jgi:hypothetical protein
VKVAKLAAMVGVVATVSVAVAAPASAAQYCGSKNGWNICIEEHEPRVWYARGWGPSTAWVSLWTVEGKELSFVLVPPGGGNLTTGGNVRGEDACIGGTPGGPDFYQCIRRP